MRHLGTRLGVTAMSLHRHVPSRDALLTAVVDHVFAGAVAEFYDTWFHAGLTAMVTGFHHRLGDRPLSRHQASRHLPLDMQVEACL